MRERLVWIDNLKGFLILMVIIGHILGGYINANIYSDSDAVMRMVYTLIYTFHMPAFILVSGYMFELAYVDNDKTKLNKLFRQILNIAILYVLFSLLQGSIQLLFSRFTNSHTSISSLLTIWRDPIFPYWYLYVLAELYLIFSINRLRNSNGTVLFVILLAISAFALLLNDFGFCIQKLLYYLLFFYLGIKYNSWSKYINKWIALATFAAAIALIIAFYDRQTHIHEIVPINTFVALFLCITIMFYFQNKNKFRLNNILQLCGQYCLEIYLTHCIFTAANRTILFRIGITNMYISVILNFTITLTIILSIVWLLKKIHLHQLIFQPVKYIYNRKQ